MFNDKKISIAVVEKLTNRKQEEIHKKIKSLKVTTSKPTSKSRSKYSLEEVRVLLSSLYRKQYLPSKKTFCFYNFKGGVGKTSLCFQVACHLNLLGFKVLVIDADPQGHLSASFGYDGSCNLLTLYDVLAEQVGIKKAIKNVAPGLDLIPANLSLTRVESLLNDLPRREERVALSISPLEEEYDFIIFDTNPTISYLNKNILCYCKLINIVVETQAYSLNGLKILMSELASFFNKMQMVQPPILIIPNKYDDRGATSVESMSALVAYYGDFIKADFAIRRSEDFNASAKNLMPVSLFCRANSIALEDIIEISNYILEKVCDKS